MLNGEPGAVPKVIGHWMLRSVLMMPGLALAGVRDKRLITGALLSSSFVSLFLIGYTAFERQRKSRHKRSHALGSRPMYSKGPRQVRASGGVRFYASKYGLTNDEAQRLINHPNREQIVRATEQWREEHGFPAPNSPLSRGYLLDRMKLDSRITRRGGLGARYRAVVRHRKLRGASTSLCVEAKSKAAARELVEGPGRKVIRIERGC